ncbi:hypothetical protein [Georgenia deserti]|uniref:Uncharacterized protein n=1 Tax=Georgenia deserti TaxID=2093781 RepID=A0ABW4L1K9_9MICO
MTAGNLWSARPTYVVPPYLNMSAEDGIDGAPASRADRLADVVDGLVRATVGTAAWRKALTAAEAWLAETAR